MIAKNYVQFESLTTVKKGNLQIERVEWRAFSIVLGPGKSHLFAFQRVTVKV